MDEQNSNKRTRNNQIKIYLSDEEKSDFELKYSNSKCRNRGHFIRDCIFKTAIYILDFKEIREYTKQIGGIGNNLNQITRKVNSGFISPNDIEEIRQSTQIIIENQRELLRTIRLLK